MPTSVIKNAIKAITDTPEQRELLKKKEEEKFKLWQREQLGIANQVDRESAQKFREAGQLSQHIQKEVEQQIRGLEKGEGDIEKLILLANSPYATEEIRILVREVLKKQQERNKS